MKTPSSLAPWYFAPPDAAAIGDASADDLVRLA